MWWLLKVLYTKIDPSLEERKTVEQYAEMLLKSQTKELETVKEIKEELIIKLGYDQIIYSDLIPKVQSTHF
jgi:hypothetical protein